jgi:UDP-N-acetylglucosamine diphosphorylase / glucose-1-phosphate thymidylyltransferase / UDP-N-acetylgalactosamine diphosphorylase / glucosamine-1-phosphate N-acetyltransferase / galactosamine-1-phosphate N-acetyltransferase
MNDLVFAETLFDLRQSIAMPLFLKHQYAWEAIPQIKATILELAQSLSGDFERVAEDIWVGKGTSIERTAMIKGPAIIGHNCEIRHAAYIRGSVIIGDQVVVGNSTEIKNAILFNKVQAPHFNYIGDSVLGFKSHIGAGVILSNLKTTKDNVRVKNCDGSFIETGLKKFGALIGDNVEVGCNSVLNPGTIIGPESIIYPLTLVRGIIPAEIIVKNDGSMIQKRDSI